ncbi:hypothetical protein ACQ86N_22445 [Puia sp. P3]
MTTAGDGTPLPFLGSGEFYNEYGDFDYRVTVPSGHDRSRFGEN